MILVLAQGGEGQRVLVHHRQPQGRILGGTRGTWHRGVFPEDAARVRGSAGLRVGGTGPRPGSRGHTSGAAVWY